MRVIQDGKWVIRKSNAKAYNYYYMQHKHWENHAWNYVRVDFTGHCHVCVQRAPLEMQGFLKFLQWER
jgi:hypothetical protein